MTVYNIIETNPFRPVSLLRIPKHIWANATDAQLTSLINKFLCNNNTTIRIDIENKDMHILKDNDNERITIDIIGPIYNVILFTTNNIVYDIKLEK